MKHKDWFIFTISILILMDITIVLDIIFLRQIFGFLFLTILPGLLILQIFQLNKIGHIEKFVLSVGLSIFFLMFFGLLLNNTLFSLGYETPLSTIPLLISFNLAFLMLIIIRYLKNKSPIFFHMDFNLNTSEKAFLIVPILFPVLSIFGIYVMNTLDNNIILMYLFFSISIYIIFICVFNQIFPKKLYPVIILLISISLLILMSLRSNHIIGIDSHLEYFLFQTTSNNLYWTIIGSGALDSSLSISLLPTIYQSILNISPEFLFKILYSLLCSILPLIIYVISKRYVTELYSFLTSCFFMFQYGFLWTAFYARTNIALLFFSLAMMVHFNDKIDLLQKRILFIVFIVSTIVSHYSTTYIFFIIMLGTFIGVEIISAKYTFKKSINLTTLFLFFVLIFYWYSLATKTAFNAGVNFISKTIINLNKFFIEESRGGAMQSLHGDWLQKSIPHMIEFVFMWLMFAFIGIGVITLIIKHKDMSFPNLKLKKSDFLKEKFEVDYYVIVLVCSGLLSAMFILPYISKGYGIDRLFSVTNTILSIFFVIGGIILSKKLSFILKGLPNKQRKENNISHQTFKKSLAENHFASKSISDGNTSEVRAYLIILVVLIPYFFCVTGVMYNIFGIPRSINLNSYGEQYDIMYTHDQESRGAKWLQNYAQKNQQIYSADFFGALRLISQGMIPIQMIDFSSFINHRKIDGYLYLRYTNIVRGEMMGYYRKIYNLSEYSDILNKKNEIYDNGYSKIFF